MTTQPKSPNQNQHQNREQQHGASSHQQAAGHVQRAYNWLQQPFWKATPAVWIAMAVFVIVFLQWIFWQYGAFVYSGLDLAIFDQVLWNSSHGRLFAYSFDTQSYLVDHRAWALLVLVPVYWIAAHPIMLTVLQLIVVALGAVTAYMAAHAFLNSAHMPAALMPGTLKGKALEKHSALIATGFALVYLMHPIVQHMVVFEFHLLPFTMPLIFLLLRALFKQKYTHVWVLSVLLLLVREDMGLFVFGVGLYLCIEALRARSKQLASHAVGLVVVGVGWFVAMAQIGAALAPSDTTKFFIFYEWLGATPQEALLFMISHPLQTVMGALSMDHAITAIVLLFMFSFLGLLRMRFLVPAVVVLAPYFLVSEENFISIITSHYASAAIPWMMIAAFAGGVRVYAWLQQTDKFSHAPIQPKTIFLAMVVAVFAVHLYVLSPLHLRAMYASQYNPEAVEEMNAVIAQIQPDDSVMVTSKLFPYLSQREHLYTTQHVMAGTQHYSHLPYQAPERVDWIVFEQSALLNYSKLFSAEERAGATERFAQIIADNDLRIVSNTQHALVYGKVGDIVPAQSVVPIAAFETAGLPVIGNIAMQQPYVSHNLLSIPMRAVSEPNDTRTDYHAMLIWKNGQGEVVDEQIVQLGGVTPTSSWLEGDSYRVHAPITAPSNAVIADITIGDPTSKSTDALLFVPVEWTITEANALVWEALPIQ